jgi:spoIIIJ-associated protein
MDSLEISAKTVEEATQRALEQLGISRNEAEVTVLKEGKGGVLGLGAEDAVVRVSPLTAVSETDRVELARHVLEELLDKMEIEASIEPYVPPFAGGSDEAAAPIAFNLRGEDLGILIGRQGQTLSSFQYIVRLILAHRIKSQVPIIIDIEGYRERRYEALKALAERIADQVRARRAPFTLRPMPPFERRIVHLTLAEDPEVVTESIGVGEMRRVVIQPREK